MEPIDASDDRYRARGHPRLRREVEHPAPSGESRRALVIVPATTPADPFWRTNLTAFSSRPGPATPRLQPVVETVRQLLGKTPVAGICLGNQLVCLAMGARTFKLKFGHRGGNHPVKNLLTGRVDITSQNHGYAVDRESLQGTGLELTHVNLNDDTVEGVRHRDLKVITLQYHPEAAPGPWDSRPFSTSSSP